MLDVNFKFDSIKVTSIEKEDINGLYEYMKCDDFIRNIKYVPLMDAKELKNVFYEYYLNECEFFFKVLYEDKLVGLFKGRAEFKNPNEIWIIYFLKDKQYLDTIFWKTILEKLEQYFFEQYAIDNFYIVVDSKNIRFFNTFRNNGFIPTRSCKLLVKDRDKDLNIILKKDIKLNRIYR